MTNQESIFISAIKQLPNHQVFNGNGCVVIARSSANKVSQRSIWLGSASTIKNLERVLADSFHNKTIVHMGDTWRVIGVGAQRDGNTFCHLANTHRGRQQKNGWCPLQIGDWIDTEVLKSAKAGT